MADREVEDGRPSLNGTNTSRFSEKNENSTATGGSLAAVIPDEMNVVDSERDGLLHETFEEKSTAQNHDTPMKVAIIWMLVNTLATIGIVFTNKAIFSDTSLRLTQLTFAAFHFFITWLTLFTLSRPRFSMFAPKRGAVREVLPLAIAMALNVILPNLSLAFSTVTFYQVARILLTPTVALMNYILYKATLPRKAILALVPACLGVGMLGVIFACAGIFASSLYTIWVSSYHKKLNMNSMQLLYNQAPLAAFLLLYVIPFVDTFPIWTEVPVNKWVLIMMSGLFACLINMSQFFIIAQTGPVSSTVVGHVKTCSIVAIGWTISGRAVGDKALIGVIIALGGIIT
ncbi:hypothetical protein EPUL_002777 [Erysiphe pulchra]|uniref:GDP-mannose transporter n=1 Tax=Erysiphe pulchra TaxID=225359 RepID=A0A2S4PSN4_9PEZI|nr:hypothetical protein EPUL_002777 [Erysiphe pulchra]